MKDLIDREAALNCFHSWVNQYGDVYTPDEIPEYQAIEALPSVEAGATWIPCSERLPEKGEYGKVLVTYIPSGGTLWTTVIIAHYSDLMGIAKPSFHIGNVGKNDFINITEQVTAWMPLPEPYREERTEE